MQKSLKAEAARTGDKSLPRWTDYNDDKLNSAQFCLLDHPECWKIAGLSKTAILRNRRLTKLMNAPKNLIIKLPEPTGVVLQFLCANCNGIPFPCAASPHTSGFKLTYSQAVFMCKQGHPICRACYESFPRCVFDEVDNNYLCQQTDSTGKSRATTSVSQQYLQSVPPIITGMWMGPNICLMQKSAFKCMFLTNMIRSAEFACKNFNMGCDFRGRGSELQKHEEICPHTLQLVPTGENHVATSLSDGETLQNQVNNDSEILKIKMDDIVSHARSMILSTLDNHKEQIAVEQLRGKYTYEPKNFKPPINKNICCNK